MAIFIFLYGLVGARLFCVQILDHDKYEARAESLRDRRFKIQANRGVISDRAGLELARNLPVCAVYVQPSKIKDPNDRKLVIDQLSSILGLERSAVAETVESGRGFIYLGRQLPVEVGEKVKAAKLPYVGVLPEIKRIYPSGSLAAQVVGFTNTDGIGIEGIERSANAELAGKNGLIVAEVDPRGRIIAETRSEVVSPADGSNISLTVDAYLQHVAEEALDKSFKTYKAAGATAIVMDPHTGEILALASCPTFDLNNRKSLKAEQYRNRAIADPYEPGSTMKLFTVVAGLQEGISSTEILCSCSAKGTKIGKKTVRCSLHGEQRATGHGRVDMYGVIKDSCNIGAAGIGFRLGAEKLYSYLDTFGLLRNPGSGMRGERTLPLERPDTWARIKLANVAFGQGIMVNALQMAGVYCAVANGGELMKPQIIREVRNSEGKIVTPFKPVVVRRVISEENARLAREMLAGCVDEGTGKSAGIPGYTVGGKTGSAQKAVGGGKGYSGGYVASFMGMVPARDPKLVICVVVDEPKGSHFGATCAGPVFKEIAAKAMVYLRVAPDAPIEKKPKVVPEGRQATGKHRKFGAGHTG